MTDEIVRILSIDGGGIRGIIPARILQRIEEATSRPARELFHLVAGTSTGGIIGCGLLKGKTAGLPPPAPRGMFQSSPMARDDKESSDAGPESVLARTIQSR